MKETGCCPRLNSSQWHKKTHKWSNKPFYKTKYLSIFHIPLNFGQVIVKAINELEAKKIMKKDLFMSLSREDGPFSSTLLIAIPKAVEGLPMENLSGEFISLVFEGDYKNTGKWVQETIDYVKSNKKEVKDLLFWYATCPKCAKVYGNAQTVIFARVK